MTTCDAKNGCMNEFHIHTTETSFYVVVHDFLCVYNFITICTLKNARHIGLYFMGIIYLAGKNNWLC